MWLWICTDCGEGPSSRVPVGSTSRAIFALVIALALGLGCSRRDDSIKWTELVTLPDGRVVTLSREQWFDAGVAEDGSAMAGRMTIRFVHPDKTEPIVWDSPYGLSTQALFVDRGNVYLLVAPGVGSTHEAAGCPLPLTMLFRHTDGRWMQLPLESTPMPNVEANMALDAKTNLISIRGSNFHLDAAATSGAANWTSRSYPISRLAEGNRQQFRCPDKRKPLTR